MNLKPFAAFVALALAGASFAAPTGGTFRPGQGSGTITTGPATDVTVNSTNMSSIAVIDWGSFNVAAGESVTFTHNVPGRFGITVVNVDNSGVLSQVNGTIQTALGASAPATGTTSVVLVNPNGVSIGATAAISTSGAFVATAGTADTATPSQAWGQTTPTVTIRLNSSPVTVSPAASIAGGAGALSSDLTFAASVGNNTLPAVFVSGNGTFPLIAGVGADGSGQTFTMSNSGATGVTYQLPKNAVLNVSNSVFKGNSGVMFVDAINSGSGVYGAGTATLDGLTANGGTFTMRAKSGSALNLGAVSLASGAGLNLADWLGVVNVGGGSSITGSGGNAVTLRYGGLDFAAPLTISNANVTIGPAGAFASANDSAYVPASHFYMPSSGLAKAALTVTGGSLTVTAPSGGSFDNATVTADSVSITANEIHNATVTSAGGVTLQAAGFGPGANLAIGNDGSTVNVTGGTVSAQAFGADVTIGASSTLRSTAGTDIAVQGNAVTYQAGSHQLAQGVNATSATTIIGAAQVDARTSLQQNPASLPLAPGVSVYGQNVTIAGTLQAGNPPTTPTTPQTPSVSTPTFRPLAIRPAGDVPAPTLRGAELLLPADKREGEGAGVTVND